MTTVNLNTIELLEFVGKTDKSQHGKATFPLIGAHGSKQIATVYFEIEPGDNLGRHTDSAEELLIVLEGKFSQKVTTFGIRHLFGVPPSEFLATYEDGVEVLGKKNKGILLENDRPATIGSTNSMGKRFSVTATKHPF